MPKNGHPIFCIMSQKCQNLFSGNKKPRFWDIGSRDFCVIASPENAKTFFPEIRNPDFGTSIAPFWPFLAPWSHFYFFHFSFIQSIYGLTNIAPKKFRNLPSNARFCTKR